MNRPLDHLTDALVDQYARQGSGMSSAEEHLSGCEFCLDRVLVAQRVHFGLLEADPVNHAPYPECPNEQVLQELAAGICPREAAEPALKHAAQCDHCGPLLNRYLEEFSDELTQQDQALISQLATAKPGWSERFVREQGLGTPEQAGKKSLWVRLWTKETGWRPKMSLVGALAIAVFAIAVGPTLWSRFELYRADRLVAAAYAERRTIEMRTSNAPFAKYDPYPIVRDGGGGREPDFKRPAFAKAEGTVAEKIKSGDGQWLWRQGQLSLIDTAPDSLEIAQEFLERARAKGITNRALEVDLAVAYFERDIKIQPPNLNRTMELLNRVLKDVKLGGGVRAAALFDLGIAYEKTQAWDMAIPIWEEYLRVDQSSGWADQARQHLREAKSKQLSSRQQGYERPDFFLSHLSDLAVQQDVEEYQSVGLNRWLPEAVKDTASDSYRALVALAGLLERRHADTWLKDLLRSLSPVDLPAVEALGVALRANNENEYRLALEQSLKAANLFAQRANVAGELRARVEGLYARRRVLKGADCLAVADPIWQRLSQGHYRWLQAQFILERGECKNLRGEFSESEADLGTSRKIAAEYGFPMLVLRNIGISAGTKHLQGKCDESWKEAVEGLDLYWRGGLPQTDRLFQFYAVLLQCALETGYFYAAEALILRSLIIDESDADPVRKGLLHLHLANILLARGENDSGKREQAIATSLLTKPGESYPEQFRLYAEIEPAEFQLEQGNADLALATLDPARSVLSTSQDKFFPLNFNRVAGNIYFRLNRFEEAAASYESAIEIAETSLETITENTRRLQWIKATEESYRGLVEVLLQEHKEELALGLWEWYKNRPWMAGQPNKISTTEHSWVAIQKIISSQSRTSQGETRLVYAALKDHLAIWVLTNQGIQTKWLSLKKQDFQDAIRRFSERCATPDSSLNEIQEQGQRLYTLMLKPIRALLPEASTLIVELDPSASELPMDVLIGPDLRYFGQKYALVYSPGFLTERNMREPSAIRQHEPFLLVDASQLRGGLLPGSEMERNTILQLFRRTTIIDSRTANWEQIRQGLLNATIFHFMGHGVRDGAGSDLMLNDNLSLKARFFSMETLKHPRLAVLSACSTGIGRDNGLLDTENLVHSFLSAGVPNVIASHWNVDSASTAKLMSRFYTNLTSGEDVAVAIHNARNEMLTTQSHPYYWAGFSLVGRAH